MRYTWTVRFRARATGFRCSSLTNKIWFKSWWSRSLKQRERRVRAVPRIERILFRLSAGEVMQEEEDVR